MHKERKHHVSRQSDVHPGGPPGFAPSPPDGLCCTPLAPALANALSESAPAAADPIFALISEHRAAYAEMAALSTGPLREDCDAAMGAAMGWSDSVLLRLLTTPPTTLAGVVALLQHFSRREWNDPDNDSILVGAVAGSLAMAAAANEFTGNLAAALRGIIAGRQA
jgi:hypothetical protein